MSLGFIITFDLQDGADYAAAHAALAQAGMKREYHGTELPETCVYVHGNIQRPEAVVAALLAPYGVMRVAAGAGCTVWTKPSRPGATAAVRDGSPDPARA